MRCVGLRLVVFGWVVASMGCVRGVVPVRTACRFTRSAPVQGVRLRLNNALQQRQPRSPADFCNEIRLKAVDPETLVH